MKRKNAIDTSSEGRVKFQRSFEHVDGNWPTFVFIPGLSYFRLFLMFYELKYFSL